METSRINHISPSCLVFFIFKHKLVSALGVTGCALSKQRRVAAVGCRSSYRQNEAGWRICVGVTGPEEVQPSPKTDVEASVSLNTFYLGPLRELCFASSTGLTSRYLWLELH